jgi:hypothetical protein
MLSLIKSIRKPATPPSNRHEGRGVPRPTSGDIRNEALQDEIDVFCPCKPTGNCGTQCDCDFEE